MTKGAIRKPRTPVTLALATFAVWGTACVLADPKVKTVELQDLSPLVRKALQPHTASAAEFNGYLNSIRTSTANRERDGENDHLIFYILQSKEFTQAPRIEPALNAKEFLEHSRVPANAEARMRAFAESSLDTERLRYFRTLLPRKSVLDFLHREYARAMRSLYEKEFTGRSNYYESRGHSTDTEITANYAIWTALSVLRASQPQLRLDRVLIVGPGLNIAPRTDLVDRFPPQSYQPYVVSQMLRDLRATAAPQIHCVDINDRVIEFIREFPVRGDRTLDFRIPPGNADFEMWARNLALKLRAVPRKTAEAVTAQKLNVVTERLDSTYDLVIATNVLVYLNDSELLLAVANIGAMLREGGYFIHNEVRPVLETWAAASRLTAMQARTVKIAEGTKAPLYDAFVIHRKQAAEATSAADTAAKR